MQACHREHFLFPFHAMRFRKEVMPSRTRNLKGRMSTLSWHRDC